VKPGAHDAPPADERDEGWDESVLVWNATVATIPAPHASPDSAQEIAGLPTGPHDQMQRQ
jgi:hypothetical protein